MTAVDNTVRGDRFVFPQLEEPAALPAGNPSPVIGLRPNLVCSQSSATSITAFLGSPRGREFVLRLDHLTTIVASNEIRTKGGTNVSGNSNNLIGFRKMDAVNNIWFETWRNF